ncbi:MAG TPA: alpha-hydroxy acid oxidase [Ktedonobacterales bacterium]
MKPINLHEYEALARERMDPTGFEYYLGGSDDEVTLRENRAAFERLRLRPRVLVDVSALDLATTALGTPISMPALIAPTAYHRLAHPEGEVATARAAKEAGVVMGVAALATTPLEVVAEAGGPLWFQLYVYRDRSISERLVRRAEDAGYRALVLTVDTPRVGNRERDVRNGFTLPTGLRMANFVAENLAEAPEAAPGESGLATFSVAHFDPTLTWEALEWLRSVTKLPIVVKGILTGEDAALAVEHGAAGVIVSNHGGRQLDTAVATMDALPEVVEAVAGGCEVYVDGGVRRGTDVLKALALGARAVLLGRPILWALAADGQQGVGDALALLRGEIELAMMLAGRPTLASIDRSLIMRVDH